MASFHPHYLTCILQTYHNPVHRFRSWASVHAGGCRIYEQSGPQNKQHCTTHGNAPKGSGSYRRPKNSHSQHSGSYDTGSGVCLFHMYVPLHPRPAFQKRNVMQNAVLRISHRMHAKTQTYNISMTKHSYFPYTSTYSSTCHNRNRIHNIHHNTQHTLPFPRLKNTIFNNVR